MIDIKTTRCIRVAEEMANTRRSLLQAADSLADACSVLRSSSDDSMHVVAKRIEQYIADIERESRVSETMTLMLEKIAESYMRAENDSHDYIDQIYVAPVVYATVMLGPVTTKAKEVFEEF